jgi:hypothetical protein
VGVRQDVGVVRRPSGAASAIDFRAMLNVLAETAAEEGKKVVLSMLVVGLIFVSVIAIGELTHWLRARR